MNRPLTIALIFLLTAHLLANGQCAPAAPAAQTEDQLIDVLKSKAAVAEKNKACRELKLVGTEKSIPVLAGLLSHAKLWHPARLALESMPYPAAGAALRKAVEKTSGPMRSGLIDGLGERRDAAAVPILAKSLDDPDKQVLAAAAWALGKIGTMDAANALRKALSEATGERRATIAQGLVLCCKTLIRNSASDNDWPLDQIAVKEVFSQLSARGEAKNVRAAALAGYVRIKDPDRSDSVLSFLTSDDEMKRVAAAGALPELNAAELSKIAAHANELPAASEVSLLSAIRIRGDSKLSPVVLNALANTNDDVRLAAIRALATVGNASALQPLVSIASMEGPLAEAARKSIESLGGPSVDATIFTSLHNETEPSRRAQWIDVISYRRPAGAVVVLLKEAQHGDPLVRGHAMTALEQLATLQDLPGLLAGVLAAKQGPERNAAELSVVRIGLQIKDAEKRSETVLAAVDAAPGDHLVLLPLAGRFGGRSVMAKVQAALADGNPAIHAAGLLALCNWPDASVADQLLDLTKHVEDPSTRGMLLHAYTRVVSLPTAGSNEQRLDRLKQAMALAQHDDEKAYILVRASAVRSVESLRFVLPYVDQPALAATACKSVADLAHNKELRDPNKAEFGPALEKVLHTSKERPILERVKLYLESIPAA